MSDTVTSESPLKAVKEIEPIIREHAPRGEVECRLSDPVVDAMRGVGLYRIWVPEAFGGLEADPMTGMRVFEEVSRIDSAAGWNLGISVLSSIFVPFLQVEAASEIFDTADVILGGALNPPGTAIPVDGGYRLTARMPFISGCHHCAWVIGPALVKENGGLRQFDNGEPMILLMAFPTKDADIIDHWDTLGMRGTGSHDVAVKDLFIPEQRTGLLVPLESPKKAFEGPLYRYTIWPTLGALACVATGIARAAIEELVEIAKAKTPAFTQSRLRDRAVAQSQVGQAEAKLGAASAYLYEAFGEPWEDAVDGRNLTSEQKIKIQLASTHAALASAEAVDLVHAAAGTSAIRKERELQRHFRDVHTITQQGLISASRYESMGQLMFGLETDWPFFGL